MNAAVDAAVCLLLVSAAVVGLVSVEQSPPATPGRADAVANALATTNAQVDYSLAPGVRELAATNGSDASDRTARAPDWDALAADRAGVEDALGSPELDRTAHGSLAGLLARAATATSGLDERRRIGTPGTGAPAAAAAVDADPASTPLTRTREDFRRGVRDAVRARTGRHVRVDAVWRPYPDAPVGGAVGVGPHPPGDGVHAATLAVPTGAEPIPPAAGSSFETLGAAVAERTVSILVPAGPARVTLRGNDPSAALVRHRYARLASATNASLAEPLATEDTDAANARVAAALAPAMAADLRDRYDAPAEAAEAVSVSSVRIVVRTWSPSAGDR
ncbi:DUF7284 family protein [Halobellus sp. GM3]|uniref:DUF7284 family protein n=1 Tax=Halobellus sp. GM3 TaxID=3458410 RepID=UPI00403D77CB